jgi:dTDP-4-dehydrorhamnose reductase
VTSYLVAGAAGMLGRDLQKALARARAGGRQVTALTRAQLDVTDRGAVQAAAVGHDFVINVSAYTNVDGAEANEDEAYAINALGVENLAIAAHEHGAKFLTISTDYVFDGSGTMPYPEDAPRDPLNAYGRTKAAGEELALAANPDGTYIVRTAWLYGEHGPNFAKTMLRLAGEREEITVIDDQIGQPTWTADLAVAIVRLLDAEAPAGTYHGTNSGQTSWFGFARAVFEQAGLDPDRIVATDSASYLRPAPRPSYSVLGHSGWARAGLAPLRDWREALAAAAASGVLRP